MKPCVAGHVAVWPAVCLHIQCLSVLGQPQKDGFIFSTACAVVGVHNPYLTSCSVRVTVTGASVLC